VSEIFGFTHGQVLRRLGYGWLGSAQLLMAWKLLTNWESRAAIEPLAYSGFGSALAQPQLSTN
jgi:hypothetical protein